MGRRTCAARAAPLARRAAPAARAASRSSERRVLQSGQTGCPVQADTASFPSLESSARTANERHKVAKLQLNVRKRLHRIRKNDRLFNVRTRAPDDVVAASRSPHDVVAP